MKTTMKLVKIALASTLLIALAACASRGVATTQMGGTEIALKPADIEIKGPTSGKSCVPVILGLQFSQTSVQEAETEALSAVGADMMIDKVNYIALETQIGGTCLAVGGGGFCAGMLYASKCQYVEGLGIVLK